MPKYYQDLFYTFNNGIVKNLGNHQGSGYVHSYSPTRIENLKSLNAYIVHNIREALRWHLGHDLHILWLSNFNLVIQSKAELLYFTAI